MYIDVMGVRWLARLARRAPSLAVCLALLLAPSAFAVPTVGFKAKAVPIAGFPLTGNHLGAGAALRFEYTISGAEYGGFPAPLEGINLYLPRGLVVHPRGFPTCPVRTNEPRAGGYYCPKGSTAGPAGILHSEVAFGAKRRPRRRRSIPPTRPAAIWAWWCSATHRRCSK